MSDDALLQRIRALEADNAHLRRQLEQRGPTAGLRHQIRNTLAMVRDVVRQSAERLDGADDYSAHLDGRLDAVFRIQNAIANASLDGVPLDILIADELQAQAVSEGDRLSVEGPDVLLQPVAAGTIALAMHELATNAIKFGALSAPAGRIAVSWTVEAEGGGERWLTLRWVETGVADVPAEPPARGFGSEAIEGAVRHQLDGDGSLAFAPGGIRCTIRLPFTPWIGALREGVEGQADRA